MITKRDGNALTLERIKDPRSSALGNSQEIYGRGKIWRLTQAWIKKGFDDNTVQFKLVVWACQMTLTAHNVNFKTFALWWAAWKIDWFDLVQLASGTLGRKCQIPICT
jgi:carbohydrate-selective porin OprB